jgi:hypothetical protein
MRLGARPHVVFPSEKKLRRHLRTTVTITFVFRNLSGARIDIQVKAPIEQSNPRMDGGAAMMKSFSSSEMS